MAPGRGARAALAFVLLPTCLAMACRREYFDPEDVGAPARLKAYLAGVMESRPIPGLAIGVVKGETLLFSETYGVQNARSRSPVMPETLFHTASLSKMLTATTVMQLKGEGRLDLEASVARYLPYFRLADPRAGAITLRHLLSHTSGLPADLEGDWWATPEVDSGALERYVRGLADQKLLFAPGERWQYSNIGYNVLGDVIAKATGMEFEAAVRERLMAPLGMMRSTFLPLGADAMQVAWPHRGSLAPRPSDVYPYDRASAPSSTLKSDVLEMSRWVAANLGRGALDGVRVIDPTLLESMWKPQIGIDRGIKMGLGWFLRSHRGRRMVVSGARDPGFTAAIAFLPDNGVGVVVLSNYDGQSSMEMVEIADGILDVGLGREAVPPQASIGVPMARAMAGGGLDAAIAEYHRLKQAGDGRYEFGPSDLITLGHELNLAGQYDDAIRLYRLNAEEHPDYFASDLSLAQVYLKTGDKARAVEHYRKMLALNPERFGCPPSCYQIKEIEALMGGP